MSEKLCLQWNDFKENISSTFGSLREDVDFADVTLVCEDGQQVEAHKVVLAGSSPFFQNLLKRNKHPHPLVYMRSVKFENLLAIIDFLYLGETNIFQEHLDSFLSIAEDLQLKGLMGQDKEGKSEVFERPTKTPLSAIPKQVFTREQEISKSQKSTKFDEHVPRNEDKTIALTANFSGDLRELDEKVKSLMEKTPNATADGQRRLYVCKVCGKEGQSIHVQMHIESKHLEGVSVPCNQCEKTCRYRHVLSQHMKHHTNKLIN